MLYLAAALAGLPVFAPTADGTHITGFEVLRMPTLGYVAGFIVAAFIVGRLAERGLTRSIKGTVLAMIVGNLAIYTLGLLWLQRTLSASWADAFAWGLTPFLVGDAVKVLLAAGLLPAAWRLVRR